MKRVKKVVAYITCQNRLLVFKHRDFPEVGVQVPAGTVEQPDDLENEVLREAEEETGIKNLQLIKYLGARDFDASRYRPEIHERHFFHLAAPSLQAEEWLHFEMTPTGGGKPIAYNFFWCAKEEAQLDAEQGALLHLIRE